MGRPMMHRKVKHNRLREGGAEDHLQGGLSHRPAIEVIAAIPAASRQTAPAPASSGPATQISEERTRKHDKIRAELKQMLTELETEDVASQTAATP